jgi:hypothetical protein
MKTAVFTIVSLNYGAFAKTLMDSVKSQHPEWHRHVLLVDRRDSLAVFGDEEFVAMAVEDLPLPRMREFLFSSSPASGRPALHETIFPRCVSVI